MNVGRPYPVIITSPREGTRGREYMVTWETPVDGGLPITAYEFKYRRVRCCDNSSELTSSTLELTLDLLVLLVHPFNGLFSRTTYVRRHQKGKPFWILLEQQVMGWQ